MHLDDHQAFPAIDRQNMLAEIDGLPDQLEEAWRLGNSLPLALARPVRQVLVAGMGGSAIGADLLAAYAAPLASVPIIVLRSYDLPAWARSPQTLVITSSHSGNTEETLSVFEQALVSGCQVLAVSTGGKLVGAAQQAGLPVWTFEHTGQPRAAVGYSFGLLLAAVTRLGLLPDPSSELEDALKELRAQQQNLRAASPLKDNPAKRLAGQMYGRWIAVFGADHLEPVARRWKGQISEVAKTWAQFEALPEANHNSVAGVVNPEAGLRHTMTLFLRASGYHPRNRLRANLTKKIFMLEALNTDYVDARGRSRLAQQWTALHFGDYTAYYLAMAYEVDPTPVEAIEALKEQLRAAEK